MSPKTVTLTSLIFIFCVHFTESLRCFENGCYESGKYCAFPEDIWREISCPAPKKGRHLSCVVLRSYGIGGAATLRGCSYTEEPPYMGCEIQGDESEESDRVTSCHCSGDLCNIEFPDGE